MDIYTLKDMLQDTGYDVALQNPLAQEGRLRAVILAVLAAAVVAGLLWCFLGLKLIRVWAALLGLAAGFGAGFGAAVSFGLDNKIALAAGGILGLVLAILGAVFYHVGVFLVAWVTGSAMGVYILNPRDWKLMLACAGAGLVIALFTIRFAELIVIVLTGLYGAAGAGTAIAMLLPWKGRVIKLAVCAVLAVLGIAVQLLMESGRQKKKNLEKAKKIRQQNSVANDIERARAMIDEMDNKPSADRKSGAVKKQKKKKVPPKKNKKTQK